MDWINSVMPASATAQGVIILCLVIAAGFALGQVKVKGVGLGIAGILFAGILFGHLGFDIDHEVLEFVREAGLILFVYCIGMQVGPGFFASLRRQGLGLNVAAALIILGNVIVTLVAAKLAGLDNGAAAGLFSGAVTNTPSLAAAQQAIAALPAVEGAVASTAPGLSYAVAYPFAVVGIILSIQLLRVMFRIDARAETLAFENALASNVAPLKRMTLLVTNDRVQGLPLSQLPGFPAIGAVVTRVRHHGETVVAQPETPLHVGDTLLVVGPDDGIEKLRIIVGEISADDLLDTGEALTSRIIVVTRKEVLGHSPQQITTQAGVPITISRVVRNGIELLASTGMRLQYGDVLRVVGAPQDVEAASKLLGNKVDLLNHMTLMPAALGIALGVMLGSFPIEVPGIPAPLKLGLAGGPLLVAILLSRLGHWGPFVWHMPVPANNALRELGIALFLACVGVKAGHQFLDTLMTGSGFVWMGWGAAITLIPLILVGFVARKFFKWNYPTMCGLMAGSMTDPPALTFAQSITKSQAPSVAYATVYPLTMILRVIAAQVIVFLLR